MKVKQTKRKRTGRKIHVPETITKALLNWYRAEGISYPWRETSDPYRIWLSEVLLQQTRIPVALKYYEKILRAYPSLHSLVEARENEFLSFWSGAGYYARARNMLRCAKMLDANFGAEFPKDYQSLRSLPGIGRYIAAAISNVCFERLVPAIDGNTGRVLARLTDNRLLLQSNGYVQQIEEAYVSLAADAQPSEFFQSLMELGEQICLPQPRCDRCPVRSYCLANRRQTASAIPFRRLKKSSEEYYWYMLALRKDDSFYYAMDSKRAFLRDAWLFPDLFTQERFSNERLERAFHKDWQIAVRNVRTIATLRHAITFRKIQVLVCTASAFDIQKESGRWISEAELRDHHTSSVTMKVLKVLAGADPTK